MAELILTEEEIAAPQFEDWTDDALGKLCRKAAYDLRGTADETGRLMAAVCGMYLADQARRVNAAEFTIAMGDMTYRGEPVGDWLVTVERTDNP